MSSWNTDCPQWRDSCEAIRPGWGPSRRDRRAGTSAQGTSHRGSSQPGVGQMALPACLSRTVHGSVVKFFGILVGKRRAGDSSGENWSFSLGSIIISTPGQDGRAASGLSAPEVCVTRPQVLAKRRVTLFAGEPLRWCLGQLHSTTEGHFPVTAIFFLTSRSPLGQLGNVHLESAFF